jgi:hypothetical protein
MVINGKQTDAKMFAYDGCHKIYLLEDEQDLNEAASNGYELINISKLEKTFHKSCGLQFIDNWKLDKCFVSQGEADVCFES